jgi:hypothetical protein
MIILLMVFTIACNTRTQHRTHQQVTSIASENSLGVCFDFDREI